MAWRRSLISFELTTYSFARCSRTLLRICQASSGCRSVGSLPINRIAGAFSTSRIEAVAFSLPASAAAKAGKSAVR